MFFLANVCHLVTQKIQFAIHAKDFCGKNVPNLPYLNNIQKVAKI
jgi:hypothetical protein